MRSAAKYTGSPRLRRSRRSTALAVVLAVAVAIPLTLAIAQPSLRDATLRFEDGSLLLDASMTDLADEVVRERLLSGLPVVLDLHIDVVPEGGGPPIASSVRSSEIRYDLWDEQFRVRRRVDGSSTTATRASLEETVTEALSVTGATIGDAAAFRDHRGERVEARLLARLDPLTPELVHRIRRWLARPGGRAEPNDTFFGSFVGLFVNRSVQRADAELSARTAAIEVP